MVQSITAVTALRESGGARSAASGAGSLGEIDTVAERLSIAVGRTVRERAMLTVLFGHCALLERIDVRERRDGRLMQATRDARQRLLERVSDLTIVLGQMLAEHHAELDGASLHLGWARQEVRVDWNIARHVRLETDALSEVA